MRSPELGPWALVMPRCRRLRGLLLLELLLLLLKLLRTCEGVLGPLLSSLPVSVPPKGCGWWGCGWWASC